MNISEAARLTSLSTKQIRDYEKAGLVTPAQRTLSGYRCYEEADLNTLKFIRHSRDVGFSLEQIRQLLKLRQNPNRNSREVKRLTAQHIAALNKQIDILQKMVNELQQWHDSCLGNDCPECTILDGLSRERMS